MKDSLIILDRDGVLNKLTVFDDDSTESPMSYSDIEIFPWAEEQLNILHNKLGYDLVVATNQPAAAKGKISYSELTNIHFSIARILGGTDIFLDHFICYHRKEDNCNCRKPKTGMLESIFRSYPYFNKNNSWVVGDRATDIIAGFNFGLNTALLGPSVASDLDKLNSLNIKPTYCGKDLRDFVKKLSFA